MHSPIANAEQAKDDEPLWLIVQNNEQSQILELPAGAHRVVSVGSSPEASIYVERAAPIAFYFERERGGVALIQAYPDPFLRVDAQRVEGRRRLGAKTTIEFARAQLNVCVRDTPPTARTGAPIPIHRTLPEANEEMHRRQQLQQAVTREFEVCRERSAAAPLATASMVPYRTPNGTQIKTQMLSPIDLREPPKTDDPSIHAKVNRSSRGPAQLVTLEMVPVQLEQATPIVPSPALPSPEAELKTVPVPLERKSKARALQQLRRTTEILIVPARSGQTTDIELPLVPAPVMLPVAPEATSIALAEKAPSAPSQGNLERRHHEGQLQQILLRLGLATKRHPAGVLGGAVLGSVFLLLSLMGASNMLRGREAKAEKASFPSPSAMGAPEPVPSAVVSAEHEIAEARASIVAGATTIGVLAEEKPDVRVAVGHLFAGRLPEAEHAYRELALKYPSEVAFRTASRLLEKRNASSCQGDHALSKSCPSVKP